MHSICYNMSCKLREISKEVEEKPKTKKVKKDEA